MEQQREAHSGRYLADTFLVLLCIAYFYAFVTGFRMPNLWSVNYFIPSIFDGFYRRSLLGTLLQPFGDLKFNYYFIVSIQTSIFLLLNYLIIKHSIKHDRFKWMFAFFILAPTGGYLFHEIGYVDQLLVLILMAAIYVKKPVISNLLLVASLFIHEMALFFTIPLYLASRIYQGEKAAHIAVTAALCLAFFALIYFFFQTSKTADIVAFVERLENAAKYPVRVDYYTIYLHELTGERQQIYYNKREALNIFILLPLFLLVGAVFSRRATSRGGKLFLACAGAGAAASPLLLGLFGSDTSRWIFLSVSAATFSMYLAREHLTALDVKIWAFILVVFLLFSELIYFDEYSPRQRIENGLPHFFLHDVAKELTHFPNDRRWEELNVD